MKLQKLLVLVAIFFVILAAFFMNETQKKKKAQDTKEALLTRLVLGEESDVHSARRMEIRRAGDDAQKVLLARGADGAWLLESQYGLPARKESVEAFLNQIKDSRGELRSDEAAVLADYRLGDGEGIMIAIELESKKIELLLSDMRPRGTQNFVRLKDSNAVIATDADLLARLGIFSEENKISYKSFADFRLISMDSAQVQSVVLTPENAKSLSFERDESVKDTTAWKLKEDPSADIDPSKVGEMMSSASNLYAQDNADPAAHEKEFAGKAPFLRVQMKPGNNPPSFELTAGGRDSAQKTVRVRRTPGGHVYVLGEANVDVLLKKNKEFFTRQKKS